MDLKIATVKRHYLAGVIDDCYLIEDMVDLASYSKLRVNHVEMALKHTMRSPLPIHKFDHDIPSNTPMAGMMSLAWHRAKSAPDGFPFMGNPFFQIEGAAMAGINAMTKAVSRGDTVIANRNGGWCIAAPGLIEILSTRVGSLEESLKPIKIPTGAHWMALENDTQLSDRAQKFLASKDARYALITSLRERKGDEVTRSIRHFTLNDGGVIFAETTGLDEEQMRRIALALPKLGVRRVVLAALSGITEEMLTLQKEAEKSGILVTLMDRYPNDAPNPNK